VKFGRADLTFWHAPGGYAYRQHSVLDGPVSDLAPYISVYEAYPIGFMTMAEYLERHGLRIPILNLAVWMLTNDAFDPEPLIAALNPTAFGIDLHGLPRAQGALAVAERVKRRHSPYAGHLRWFLICPPHRRDNPFFMRRPRPELAPGRPWLGSGRAHLSPSSASFEVAAMVEIDAPFRHGGPSTPAMARSRPQKSL
jgi:hypothetical protein